MGSGKFAVVLQASGGWLSPKTTQAGIVRPTGIAVDEKGLCSGYIADQQQTDAPPPPPSPSASAVWWHVEWVITLSPPLLPACDAFWNRGFAEGVLQYVTRI